MAVFNFPSQRGNAEDARRRRVGIRGDFVNASLREDTPPPTKESKERLINFHISTVNAILRAKGKSELTSGDYGRIQAAAESGTATNSESIMQAVLSAATAAMPNDTQATFKQQLAEKGVDEAAYYNAIAKFGAGLGSFDAIIAAARGLRSGSMTGSGWETGQANYSSVAVANFSASDGVVSGMTPQLYREHFQAYYGATQQGQFTASRVAGILGTNEGLSGAALVRRTKEVGHDTRDRLGLDTNRYAPMVADIGKKYSEPLIGAKKKLDKAREHFERGENEQGQAQLDQAVAEHKALLERARREDPAKVPGVAGVAAGTLANSLRDGVPADKLATSMHKAYDAATTPEARAKAKEENELLLKKMEETDEGRAHAAKLRPKLTEFEKHSDERIAATAAVTTEKKINEVARAGLNDDEPTAIKTTAKLTGTGAQTEPAATQAKKEAPKKEEPKQIKSAPNGRAVGPV